MSESNNRSRMLGRLTDAYIASMSTGKSDQAMAKLQKEINADPTCPHSVETRRFIERLEQTF